MGMKWVFMIMLVISVICVNVEAKEKLCTSTNKWECKNSIYCCNETISDFFQSYQFENLFSKRNAPTAQAAGFYDYQSFITASIDFQRLGFGTTGGEKMQMKEVAAFLGHVGGKSSCGYGVVTGGPLAWGLCYNREMSPSQSYCRDGYLYPCAPGAEYYGRGALPVYCMLKTLERYRKNTTSSTSQSSEPVTFDIEDENYQDYLKLKARTEVLQQNYRNLQGEDLEPLSVKELHQLENELEVSLKQVRSTREQMLHKANKTLSKKKMDEDKAEIDLQLSWQAGEQRRQQQMDDHKAEIALQLSWQAGEQRRKQQMEDHKAEMTLHLSWQAAEQQSQFAHNHHFNAAASEGVLEPLECNPSLQIGNNLSNAVNMMNAIAPLQNLLGVFPGWTL